MSTKKTPNTSNFGYRLRKARKAAGLTQAELAEKLGCAMETISRYERGKLNPSIAVLTDIKLALGDEITADALLMDDPADWRKTYRIRDFGNVVGFDFVGAGGIEVGFDYVDIKLILKIMLKHHQSIAETPDKISKAIDTLSEYLTESQLDFEIIAKVLIAIERAKVTHQLPGERVTYDA